jgi:phosphoribosyl 1,2-cyclic phosphodiesterase
MSLQFQLLASGSRGNATVVCSEKTRVLLDAGLSARELVRRLDQATVEAKQLDAVLVSHEHTDHVRGLGTLSRRFDLPVYLTQGTLENLPQDTGGSSFEHVSERSVDVVLPMDSSKFAGEKHEGRHSASRLTKASSMPFRPSEFPINRCFIEDQTGSVPKE